MYQVIKNEEIATTHATRESAEKWIAMMAAAGMTGYTIKEIQK